MSADTSPKNVQRVIAQLERRSSIARSQGNNVVADDLAEYAALLRALVEERDRARVTPAPRPYGLALPYERPLLAPPEEA